MSTHGRIIQHYQVVIFERGRVVDSVPVRALDARDAEKQAAAILAMRGTK
jgi:hypothetical protein